MDMSLLTKTYPVEANLAGDPSPIPRVLPHGDEGPDPAPVQANPIPLCHQEENIMKKKYKDDLSVLEAIDLKSMLVPSNPIFGATKLHEIPGLHLPHEQSILQYQLADLLEFTEANKMKINSKKMKIIPFNLSKKNDFLPQLNSQTVHHLK